MKPLLWPATAWDVEELIGAMRETDRAEVLFNAKATGRYGPGWSMEGDLRGAYRMGTFWSMRLGDDLVALGGIVAMDHPGAGAIWLLGTDLADKHWRAMTRGCHAILGALVVDYAWIGNVVPAHMEKRKRWLRYMGFDMIEDKAQLARIGLCAFGMRGPHGPDA